MHICGEQSFHAYEGQEILIIQNVLNAKRLTTLQNVTKLEVFNIFEIKTRPRG